MRMAFSYPVSFFGISFGCLRGYEIFLDRLDRSKYSSLLKEGLHFSCVRIVFEFFEREDFYFKFESRKNLFFLFAKICGIIRCKI